MWAELQGHPTLGFLFSLCSIGDMVMGWRKKAQQTLPSDRPDWNTQPHCLSSQFFPSAPHCSLPRRRRTPKCPVAAHGPPRPAGATMVSSRTLLTPCSFAASLVLPVPGGQRCAGVQIRHIKSPPYLRFVVHFPTPIPQCLIN